MSLYFNWPKFGAEKIIFFIPLSQNFTAISVLDNDTMVPFFTATYSLFVTWKLKSSAGQLYTTNAWMCSKNLARGPWKAGGGGHRIGQ